MADASLKTYRGNCHCKAFVYEIDIPEIKSVGECNCSICTKTGSLWVSAAPEAFRVVKGSQDDLTSYQSASGCATQKFCPTCATSLMCTEPSAPPEKQLSFNVRALQKINPWELERYSLDAASGRTPYQPPEYTGPEPAADIENGKIYHGSCHCGALTLAVKTLPLDKDYPGRVLECACTICLKNGYIWLYLKTEQVALQADENLGLYSFGAKVLAKTFCKTCGVKLTNQAVKFTEEEAAAFPVEHYRLRRNLMTVHRPINLRVLNNFNMKDMNEPDRMTDGAEFEPKYVDP